MENRLAPDEENERDVLLMGLVGRGDTAAFTELVNRHKDAVVGTIAKMLGGYGDIEDIAQQVFIRIWKSSKSYEPSAKFTTWMFTITRNLVFNESRRLSRKKTVSQNEFEDEYGIETVDASARSPHENLEEKELSSAIDEAINALPEKARLALTLRRYQNMPYEEIAQVLDISVSAAKSLLFRARTQLKATLKDYIDSMES